MRKHHHHRHKTFPRALWKFNPPWINLLSLCRPLLRLLIGNGNEAKAVAVPAASSSAEAVPAAEVKGKDGADGNEAEVKGALPAETAPADEAAAEGKGKEGALPDAAC